MIVPKVRIMRKLVRKLRKKLKALFKFLPIILVVSLLLTGCWDKIEINNRAFVLALGLDQYETKNEFLLTLAIPNLAVVTGQASGDPAYIRQVKDQSIQGAYKQMSTRMSKQINVENLEVIIFGVGLLNNPYMVKEVFDHFERNPSYSRNLPVLVSKITGEKILKVKPQGSGVVSGYIAGIFKNNSQYLSFFNKMYLGNMLQEALEYDGNFMIPEITGSNDEVMVGGAAVMKQFEFGGWLNESEVRSIAWVRDTVKDTQVNFEYMTTTIPFVFTDSRTKIRFDLEEDHLTIFIELITEGEVTEFVFYDRGELQDEGYIKLLEDTMALQMKQEIEALIKRLQKEFKVDLLRLDQHLKIFDKDLYLQTEEHWDEFFSASEINVDVKVQVRRFGEVK